MSAGSGATGEVRGQFRALVAATTLPASLAHASRESGKTLPIFWARDAFIVVYADYAGTQIVRKSDAKRYKFVAPKKNAKTHLFGQKHQEVPCFFKEVRFEKRAPLVISREFVNPFAKTGRKSSILDRAPGRPGRHRSVPVFWAPVPENVAVTGGTRSDGVDHPSVRPVQCAGNRGEAKGFTRFRAGVPDGFREPDSGG
jgi:hypothetical protein